ncbi:MAG: SRPBCC domain-containing protein [Chitinophagales bacterium]
MKKNKSVGNIYFVIFTKAGIVTVQLKDMGDATEMILTQTQIPTDEQSRMNFHVGCSTGWTFYFANIKSILEGGLDLRNKSLSYSNVINS